MSELSDNTKYFLDDLSGAITDILRDYDQNLGFAVVLIDGDGGMQISSNIKNKAMVRYLCELAEHLERVG